MASPQSRTLWSPSSGVRRSESRQSHVTKALASGEEEMGPLEVATHAGRSTDTGKRTMHQHRRILKRKDIHRRTMQHTLPVTAWKLPWKAFA